MRKPSEKKLYSEDKNFYLLIIGGSVSALFDSEDNAVGRVVERSLDLYKLVVGERTYIVRYLKRNGRCLMYKLLDGDIVLSDPDIYSIPTSSAFNYVDLWEGLDN